MSAVDRARVHLLGARRVRGDALIDTTFAAASPVTIACSLLAHASSAARISRNRFAWSYVAV